MTQQNQIYKCSVCGNIVDVTHTGAGELVCCGQPMNLLTENTTDAATEKHVPIIKKTETGVIVKVGDVPHPMEEAHYLEWIELFVGGKQYRKFLKPGDAPLVEFKVEGEVDYARAYCNLHGLWKSN